MVFIPPVLRVVSASSSPGPRQGWEGALLLEVLGKSVSQLLPMGSDRRKRPPRSNPTCDQSPRCHSAQSTECHVHSFLKHLPEW